MFNKEKKHIFDFQEIKTSDESDNDKNIELDDIELD
jgi:hypothetical protein